jgi:DNA-binding transcriptional MerR regulator
MRRRNSPLRRRSSTLRRETVYLTRAVFCSLAGVTERELRIWEREELIVPALTAHPRGVAEPLYSRDALRRARLIRTLDELEVNLPGISVILNLLDQIDR